MSHSSDHDVQPDEAAVSPAPGMAAALSVLASTTDEELERRGWKAIGLNGTRDARHLVRAREMLGVVQAALLGDDGEAGAEAWERLYAAWKTVFASPAGGEAAANDGVAFNFGAPKPARRRPEPLPPATPVLATSARRRPESLPPTPSTPVLATSARRRPESFPPVPSTLATPKRPAPMPPAQPPAMLSPLLKETTMAGSFVPFDFDPLPFVAPPGEHESNERLPSSRAGLPFVSNTADETMTGTLIAASPSGTRSALPFVAAVTEESMEGAPAESSLRGSHLALPFTSAVADELMTATLVHEPDPFAATAPLCSTHFTSHDAATGQTAPRGSSAPFTIEQFAMLCAEYDHDDTGGERTLARYDIDSDEAYQAVLRRWKLQLADDVQLLRRYVIVYQQRRGMLGRGSST